MNMDMEIDTLRGWSNILSTNDSRELFIHSSTSSVLYVERIEALNNCPLQAEQVEDNISQESLLSYVSLKVGDTNNANKATATENTAEPHETYIDNLDTSIY